MPYVHLLFFTKNFFKSSIFQTKIRQTTITKKFRKKLIKIYTGKVYKKRLMRRRTVGYNLGDFAMTKVFGHFIDKSMALKAKQKKQDKKKK